MKRFVFRLEAVLRLRQHELELERVSLARLQGVLRALEGELEERRAQVARASERLVAAACKGVRAGELGLAERAIHAAHRRIRASEKAVAEARSPVAQALSRVRTAHTRARSLELLRERELEEHRRRMAREEQAELDEIGGRMVHYGRGEFATVELDDTAEAP